MKKTCCNVKNSRLPCRRFAGTEQDLQAQLARLNLLQHITRAIGERQNIQSVFQVVIRALEEHLPVDFCCVCLYPFPFPRRLAGGAVSSMVAAPLRSPI